MARLVLVSASLLLAQCFAQISPTSASVYTVQTVAGVYPLGDGGPAAQALLFSPSAAVADGAGNLYIADTEHMRVRKVAANGIIATVPGTEDLYTSSLALNDAGELFFATSFSVRRVSRTGAVSLVAGTGTAGFAGDGGPASRAKFDGISGIAVDRAGNLYVADMNNHRIRKVDAAGVISTFAGTGARGYAGDGGAAAGAQMGYPSGVAVDAAGNVYISDNWNGCIRKITPQGTISTIAGDGDYRTHGDGGPGLQASFMSVEGLAVDSEGNLFIADSDADRVRRLTPAGIIGTFAGKGTDGFSGDGSMAAAAELSMPMAVSTDRAGNVWICDTGNHRVRKISVDSIISTAAGSSHFAGDGGPASAALFFSPEGIALDMDGSLYVADGGNRRIRKISPSGTVTTVAGTGLLGFAGDNGPAAAATLARPTHLALDKAGNLSFTDLLRVRRILRSGPVTTVAGSGAFGFGGDGANATFAKLSLPKGVALDAAGNLYIADSLNHRVRRVAPDGVIATIAGNGSAGFAGDSAPATAAQLNTPMDVALDSSGNLYIADAGNNRIRKVGPTGIITTFAGAGTEGYGGDGGPAAAATLMFPDRLAIDAADNVYFANSYTIRKVFASSGLIATIAGTGDSGFSGDGGIATNADFDLPGGMAIDAAGNVYVADTSNHRIRKLSPVAPAQLTIVRGDNQAGTVGKPLDAPLVVNLTGAGGVAMPGVTVVFAVTSGAGTLNLRETATDPSGTAGVTLTLGAAPGPVTVTATVAGLPPVTFRLTAAEAPVVPVTPTPRIFKAGVAGGGASVPPVRKLSANGIVSIYGENFAPAGTLRTTGASDIANGRVPAKLAGVCVEVGNQRAPMLMVSPGQINVVVPAVSGAEAQVQVVTNCGEASEVKSNLEPVAIAACTPEFLYFVQNGDGRNPVIAVNAVTGAFIGPPGLISGAAFTPARPGDILSLYAIGLGRTDPAFEPGQIADKAAQVAGKVTVVLGATTLDDADVLYAGVSPTYSGLYQVNIRVPENTGDGKVPLSIKVGADEAPPGAYLTIEAALRGSAVRR